MTHIPVHRSVTVTRTASRAYLGCFAFGTMLAVRRGLGAEPLGIRTGLSPLADAVVGNGTALSAPWPLALVLWRTSRQIDDVGQRGRRARALLAVLGALFLAGSVAEPVSHRLVTRDLPLPDAALAALNIVVPSILLAGAATSLVETGQPEKGAST